MLSTSDKRLNKSNKWSDLLHLYETEISIREISEYLNVSQTSLRSKLKEFGLTNLYDTNKNQ